MVVNVLKLFNHLTDPIIQWIHKGGDCSATTLSKVNMTQSMILAVERDFTMGAIFKRKGTLRTRGLEDGLRRKVVSRNFCKASSLTSVLKYHERLPAHSMSLLLVNKY